VSETRGILSRFDEGDPTAAVELLVAIPEDLRDPRRALEIVQETLRIDFEERLAEYEAAAAGAGRR
jgi:hypothetical protein